LTAIQERAKTGSSETRKASHVSGMARSNRSYMGGLRHHVGRDRYIQSHCSNEESA
jgi:hypothetical protein